MGLNILPAQSNSIEFRFEPQGEMPAGVVITAENLKSPLTTYALKNTKAKGGKYRSGEKFIVLGASVGLKGEELAKGSRSWPLQRYFPVIQMNAECTGIIGIPVFVRIETDEDMRMDSPRFCLKGERVLLESVLEIRGASGFLPVEDFY